MIGKTAIGKIACLFSLLALLSAGPKAAHAVQLMTMLFEDVSNVTGEAAVFVDEGLKNAMICDEGDNPFQEKCGEATFSEPVLSFSDDNQHIDGVMHIQVCKADSCLTMDVTGSFDMAPELVSPIFIPGFVVYVADFDAHDFKYPENCPDPDPEDPNVENIFKQPCQDGSLQVQYRCLLLVDPTNGGQPSIVQYEQMTDTNGGAFPLQSGPFLISIDD